jgi:hypothetical protein
VVGRSELIRHEVPVCQAVIGQRSDEIGVQLLCILVDELEVELVAKQVM